jgi:GTPase SAR1 family protein
MTLPRSLRILIAMAVAVLGLAALLLLLTLSEATLNIRAHLATEPWWLQAAFWGALGLFGLLLGAILWRLLRPEQRPSDTAPAGRAPDAPSEAELEQAIADAEAMGADTATIRAELRQLGQRREAGEIHVALFGEISTGKSSLIGALLPDAHTESDVRGGTTRTLQRHRWTSRGGDSLLITDMPGTGEADGHLDALASDEAKRAHVVLYVTDGDLNRVQHRALQDLLALRKPLILVLNKTDRYDDNETAMLSQRLQDLLGDCDNCSFVAVSAARSREVIRELPDGSEVSERRAIAPQVGPLLTALQRQVDGDPEALARLRDSATFVLARQKLDAAVAEARRSKAERIVDGYAVKAVVGALAAITPGTDLVIQGWLGTRLVRELAELYGTRVGKVDTELLLELVQQHVGRAHTLLLAVAGNALKAFPGIGTLAGGALHAVAYGIIFRTLGRALTTTLATRGELHPRQAAKLFEETLGGSLETSAKNAARVVAQHARGDERPQG